MDGNIRIYSFPKWLEGKSVFGDYLVVFKIRLL
jgi:hypothetical protein